MLSHLSAAGLWELLPPLLAPVHVTVPTDAGRSRRPAIRLHRSPHLPVDAVTHHRGIAATTPARTLADLHRTIPAAEYRQALREAAYRGMDLTDIEHDGIRSEPERRFVAFCRRRHIPAAEANQPIGRFTVDFLWRTERLVVETDAWSSHRGSQAFETTTSVTWSCGGSATGSSASPTARCARVHMRLPLPCATLWWRVPQAIPE